MKLYVIAALALIGSLFVYRNCEPIQLSQTETNKTRFSSSFCANLDFNFSLLSHYQAGEPVVLEVASDNKQDLPGDIHWKIPVLPGGQSYHEVAGASITHVFTQPGLYEVIVEAKDSSCKQAVNSKSYHIYVGSDSQQCLNSALAINGSPNPSVSGEKVNFDLIGNKNCDFDNLNWDFSQNEENNISREHVSRSFTKPGTYLVGVDFSQDAKNHQVKTLQTVVGSCPDVDELFISGPQVVTTGSRHIYRVHVDDSNCIDLKNVTWEFADGKTFKAFAASHSFVESGVKSIAAQANYIDPLTGTEKTISLQHKVSVFNSNCKDLHNLFVSGPAVGYTNEALLFSLNLPSCIKAKKIFWNMGDGQFFADGSSQTHNFKQNGNFIVAVTVTTEQEQQIELSRKVQISDRYIWRQTHGDCIGDCDSGKGQMKLVYYCYDNATGNKIFSDQGIPEGTCALSDRPLDHGKLFACNSKKTKSCQLSEFSINHVVKGISQDNVFKDSSFMAEVLDSSVNLNVNIERVSWFFTSHSGRRLHANEYDCEMSPGNFTHQKSYICNSPGRYYNNAIVQFNEGYTKQVRREFNVEYDKDIINVALKPRPIPEFYYTNVSNHIAIDWASPNTMNLTERDVFRLETPSFEDLPKGPKNCKADLKPAAAQPLRAFTIECDTPGLGVVNLPIVLKETGQRVYATANFKAIDPSDLPFALALKPLYRIEANSEMKAKIEVDYEISDVNKIDDIRTSSWKLLRTPSGKCQIEQHKDHVIVKSCQANSERDLGTVQILYTMVHKNGRKGETIATFQVVPPQCPVGSEYDLSKQECVAVGIISEHNFPDKVEPGRELANARVSFNSPYNHSPLFNSLEFNIAFSTISGDARCEHSSGRYKGHISVDYICHGLGEIEMSYKGLSKENSQPYSGQHKFTVRCPEGTVYYKYRCRQPSSSLNFLAMQNYELPLGDGAKAEHEFMIYYFTNTGRILTTEDVKLELEPKDNCEINKVELIKSKSDSQRFGVKFKACNKPGSVKVTASVPFLDEQISKVQSFKVSCPDDSQWGDDGQCFVPKKPEQD